MTVDELVAAGRLAAHMLRAGLRARSAPGAHEVAGLYALAAIGGDATAEFDRVRRFRNRVEYGATPLSPGQVRHDLAIAAAIVAACRA